MSRDQNQPTMKKKNACIPMLTHPMLDTCYEYGIYIERVFFSGAVSTWGAPRIHTPSHPKTLVLWRKIKRAKIPDGQHNSPMAYDKYATKNNAPQQARKASTIFWVDPFRTEKLSHTKFK